MAGHSKWANIKHKKAKEDAARGKAFTKLIKEITVAARTGGGNPDNNPRLRLLIEKGREINMPKDNVTRAIKKGTGELPGVHYEQAMYEGYGPSSIAILVDLLTDNKNRAVAELRKFFSRRGGNLAEGGAVSWMFEKCGVITTSSEGTNEDDLLEKLIDYDIKDVSCGGEICRVVCEVNDLENIKQAVTNAGLTIKEAELEWVPKDAMGLSGEDAEKAYEFLSELEDLDDVQNVYTNLS